jgi:DNA-directed RNA polymerase alpha subunit
MIKTLLTCIESKVESNRSLYGRFQLGPFQLGQGLTVANGLRRSMLSELTGIAIVAVEIKEAIHEYSTLKGIQESVFDILLNLKQITIKSQLPLNSPQIGFLQESGPTVVRARDLKLPPSIQIVDPQQYIATISRDGSLKLKFLIWQGKNQSIQPFSICFQKTTPIGGNTKVADSPPLGVQREEEVKSNLNQFSVNKKTINKQITKNLSFFLRDTFLYFDSLTEQLEINSVKNIENKNKLIDQKKKIFSSNSEKEKNSFFYFKLDPIFTPVNNVNFVVEVDDNLEEPKDRIILEIWTNGTIKPRDAIYGGAKALIKLFGSFQTILPTGNLLNLGNISQKFTTEEKNLNSFIPSAGGLFTTPDRSEAHQINNLPYAQKYNFKSSYLYSLRLQTKETSVLNAQKNSSNFISFFPQNWKEHYKNGNPTLLKYSPLEEELENHDFLQNKNSKSKKWINENNIFLSRHTNKTKKKTFLKNLSLKRKENLLLSNDLNFLDIENLDFSLRLFALLKQAKIHTLRDLVQYSRENLLSIKGLNHNFVDQIEKKLSKMELSLLK